MTVLVRDSGFTPDDWPHAYVPVVALSRTPDTEFLLGVDLPNAAITPLQWERLCDALGRTGLIRIGIRDFGDGAACDFAGSLRARGYRGRLRAHGAVLARSYTLYRRAGFDEIELSRDQARRQSAEHWRFDPSWHPGALPPGLARLWSLPSE